MLVGLTLQWADFRPNEVQSEETLWTIRLLMSGLTASCYLLGTLIFATFRLDEATHRQIRLELDART